MKRTCKQCGKDFFLSKSEVDFYNKKNLSLPKRCKECREANKANAGAQESAAVTTAYNTVTNADASAGSKPKKNKLWTIIFAIVLLGILFYLTLGKTTSAIIGQNVVDDLAETSLDVDINVSFRNEKLLTQHYEKHGIEMGFGSAVDYEAAACAVVNNPNALHKIEAEDGDDIYYLEASNEFVVVSTDGYIRTYFKPDSGKKYYDKQ